MIHILFLSSCLHFKISTFINGYIEGFPRIDAVKVGTVKVFSNGCTGVFFSQERKMIDTEHSTDRVVLKIRLFIKKGFKKKKIT
jgi:hypothetical protein